MFKEFKTAFQARVKSMLTGGKTIYMVDVAGDDMWNAYLSGFPEAERQGHTCNACRSFIRHYGNMVTIVDNKIQTIWEFQTISEYQEAINAVHALVVAKPIKDLFVSKEAVLGIDHNFQQVEGGSPVRWDHFSLAIPMSSLIHPGALSEDSIRGDLRTGRAVFKRSLDELTIDATETVLELIAQNSLYRGEEFKAMLNQFLKVQKLYATVKLEEKDNFVWVQAMTKDNGFITKMRNTSIGTLLEDLSLGIELDAAVGKFERMMAPTNYKRPTALVTPKMVEQAKEKLTELGLMDSIARRFAVVDDITVDNLLFVNRDSVTEKGLFEGLAADQPINPRTLSKVESVTLDEFISNILPHSISVELLLENKHEPNLVSLIAPVKAESTSMFKWENRFSWSYNNALADSMKEKVKAAGGKVDGVLRFSIEWNDDGKSICDFDAHCKGPGGNIYFGDKRDAFGGQLDVDMVRPRGTGIENITWSDLNRMKDGIYKFAINNFDSGRNTGFSAEIEFNGEVYSFGSNVHTSGMTQVAEVTLKNGVFTIKPILQSSSAVVSKEVWDLKTNKFQKVNGIMYSPNHWDGQGVGNKHVFFMLEGAKNTGLVRGFFNENLKADLDPHRKVFEVLASKATVQQVDNQLSGVGFSTTSKNEFICKVTGKFTRTVKVTI